MSDDAEDPIPATGFTVWDAGVLLGAYVSQPEAWRRLTTASDVPPRKLEAKLDAMAPTLMGGRRTVVDGFERTCQ